MPNIKSSKKRVQVGERNRLRNVAIKSDMRTAIKKVRLAVAEANAEAANTALSLAFKAVDKAVKRKVIHKNNAARIKSKLSAAIKTLAS